MEDLILTIKGSGNLKVDLLVPRHTTLIELKTLIQSKIRESSATDPQNPSSDANLVPLESMRLIYVGKVLTQDEETLQNFGIQSGKVIHLVISRSAPGTSESAAVNSAQTQQIERMMGIMDNPLMESILGNTELMENLILSNPQIQELTRNNPELRSVLTNPNTLREAVRAMQNPNLRREIMRNTDRAMANIENLPGGFDALSRMYHTIQEPMLDAMTQQTSNLSSTLSDSSSSESPRPSNSLDPQRPTNTPLPNPWSAPSFGGIQGGLGGLGGLSGLGGFPLFGGNTNDNTNTNQNPFSTMMQQMLQNPQLMQQAMSMFTGGMGGNPGTGTDFSAFTQEILQNPELMSQMMNPQTLQAASSLMGSLQTNNPGMGAPGYGMGLPGYGMGFPGYGMGLPGYGMGFPGYGVNPSPQQPTQPQQQQPQERFAVQLQQMAEMGFSDTQKNVEALKATGGNVDRAIQLILEGQ